MTEGENARLVAWAHEMRAVHDRLRQALELVRDAVADGAEAEVAARDLLLFCHGFCTALTGHHEGEDRQLFPTIAAAHPELRDTLRKLEQDHSMMTHLIGGLQQAGDGGASPAELERYLDAEVGEVFGLVRSARAQRAVRESSGDSSPSQ